jgi:eukaryotic-like serine/threonine-protein kinase
MSALERGNIVAGRYRLERALAQGGMGCVWVARHLQLDTQVAIKFMTPQFAASADARARFEREARTSAALRLANAVQIHDYGVEDGAPFLVMELLEGEDLQARLKREPRLSLPVTVGILGQVCRALRRAHEVGIVHRDLKPGNVFLAREGGEEVVKLLDFGIAKDTQAAFGGGVTGTGALLGSPHYMSPEQVRSSNRVDHRTDLWALGVIAFRCLTGRLPFPSEELGEVLIDVCTAPIPLASAIAPDLGPGVDHFFARALTRDPAGRFQSADELMDALIAMGGAVAMVGAQAPLVAMVEAQAPRVDAAVPPLVTGGTLSPSAQTRNEPAERAKSRRSAILLLAGSAAATLVSVLLAFFLLSGREGASAASTGPASAAALTSVTSTPPRTLPAAPEPSAEAVPPVVPPPATVAGTPPPPATVAPSSRPPVKSAPVRNPAGPPSKSDDLLNHI